MFLDIDGNRVFTLSFGQAPRTILAGQRVVALEVFDTETVTAGCGDGGGWMSFDGGASWHVAPRVPRTSMYVSTTATIRPSAMMMMTFTLSSTPRRFMK